MPNDDHVALLGHGVAAWNAWRAESGETPDLSGAGLRGLDLTGFDLSRADLRNTDLRGTNLRQSNLSGAHLERANLFKAVFDGADLAGAFLTGAQFLNCAQLIVTRNWQSAFRDETLGCGASIPDKLKLVRSAHTNSLGCSSANQALHTGSSLRSLPQ
jgi:hypothetical protein